MKTPLAAPLLSAFLALSLTFACDNKDEASKPPTPEETAKKAKKQKETADALLRENGIDPASITDAPPAQKQAVPPAGAAAAGAGAAPLAKVELLEPGTGKKVALRYKFEANRTIKFDMRMKISPNRTVNGQPEAGMPPVKIMLKGESKTLGVEGNLAKRENTFLDINPGAEGLPPAVLGQMKAQFAGLIGVQLIETVNERGQLLDTALKPGSRVNPQTISLLQNLQEGISKAFVPLPVEEVGVGAKWRTVNVVNSGGLVVTQINEVKLSSLKGTKVKFELSFSQTADKQILQTPGLPPGAQVELLAMKGTGKGSMDVDLATLIAKSEFDIDMSVDTKISGAGSPQPIMTATSTGMTIKMETTK